MAVSTATQQQPLLFEQFYNFPPFFTLQPTPQTRVRQLDLWTKLIQSTCKTSNQFILTRNEQIFTNPDIKRSLSNDFITELFNHMVSNHTALPNRNNESTTSPVHNNQHNRSLDSVIVLFLPKERWYEKLRDYAKRNGLVGGIATTYEILNDDEFNGMEQYVLELLLKHMMVDTRECEVMVGNSGGGVEGVKFF